MKKKQIKIYYDKKQILLQNYKPSGIIAKKFSLHYEKITNLRSVFLDFQSSGEQYRIVLWTDKEFKSMKRNFFSLFQNVPAAGGVVRNEKNEILVIFRNGKWDLPKGKADRKKESLRATAKREVKEETGLKNLQVTGKLFPTYHIYSCRNNLCLKKTSWYEMIELSTSRLIPQTEEKIEMVKWIGKGELPEIIANTYESLKDLFTAHRLYQPET